MDLTITEMAEILHASIHGPLTARLARRKLSLCTDSRALGKGQVFWALKGERFDGHQYLEECFGKGAWAAVVEGRWHKQRARKDRIYLPVADTTSALLTLAEAYAARFRTPKVSLTGSNGKTTTKDMLVGILSRAGKTLGTKGNLNNHIGVPLTLFGLNKAHKYAVVEMGTNHPGEIKMLAQAVHADIGIITNVGDSHLEFLGSRAGVYREKKSITQGFHKHSVLIVNADDEYLSRLENDPKRRVVSFGIDRGRVRAREVVFDETGCVGFKVGRTRFQLRVPGRHNVYNALAAIAASRQLGVSMQTISQALGRFKPGARRMQVKEIKGIRLYDDCYNANPDSMLAAVEILAGARVSGQTVAVLADMKELGASGKKLHWELGKYVARAGLDRLYTFGKLAAETARGARAAGMGQAHIHSFTDMEKLTRELGNQVKPGDALLIKGSRTMYMERVITYLEKEYHTSKA